MFAFLSCGAILSFLLGPHLGSQRWLLLQQDWLRDNQEVPALTPSQTILGGQCPGLAGTQSPFL